MPKLVTYHSEGGAQQAGWELFEGSSPSAITCPPQEAEVMSSASAFVKVMSESLLEMENVQAGITEFYRAYLLWQGHPIWSKAAFYGRSKVFD